MWTLHRAARGLIAAIVLAAFPIAARADLAAMIARGDELDAQLQTARALEVYLEAEKLGANDVELLWRVARQYALSMNDTESREEQQKLGEKALEYALRAVEADPGHPKAHLSVAICYGRLVPFVGARKKVEYSRLIHAHAQAALKREPSDSYAWHVLGVWHYELSQMGPMLRTVVKVVYGGVPEASMEEAVRLFRRAVELAPERVAHHTELGRAYAALGRTGEARAALERALALPAREKDDPESKRRAREALAAL